MHQQARAPLGRCVAIWGLGTALVAGVGTTLRPWLLGDLGAIVDLIRRGPSDGMPLDVLLTQGAGLVLVGSLLWLWVIGTVTVVEAASGRVAASRVPAPAILRRFLLAACGVGLAAQALPAAGVIPDPDIAPRDASGASQVAGDIRGVLTGLPLPDRAEGDPAGHWARQTLVVGPGETLWALAADRLPDGASDAEIADTWQAIYRANDATIGADPDLIQPGTRLRLPRSLARNDRAPNDTAPQDSAPQDSAPLDSEPHDREEPR